jgi:hypothetical protein
LRDEKGDEVEIREGAPVTVTIEADKKGMIKTSSS